MQVPASPSFAQYQENAIDILDSRGNQLPECSALAGQDNPADAAKLLEFKSSFTNANSTVLSTWAGTNHCRGWPGVTCDNAGRVAEM